MSSNFQFKAYEGEVLPGVKCAVYPMDVSGIVTVFGSFRGGYMFAGEGARPIARLTSAMLDQGTTEKTKDAFHDALERSGISLTFMTDAECQRFSVTVRREHLEKALGLLSEALCGPLFDPELFEKEKARSVEWMERRKDNPDAQAERTLIHTLYAPGHPNFLPTTDEEIAATRAVSVRDARGYHRKYFKGDLLLSAAGDISGKEFSVIARMAFRSWNARERGSSALSVPTGQKRVARKEITVVIPKKPSATAMIGATTPLTANDPSFLPFTAALGILGSGFISRLTRRIREEEGLTYDIRAYASPASPCRTSGWIVRGTFAPEAFEKGLRLTREEMRIFAEKGVTEKEVAMRKDTLRGKYVIALSTTEGMAAQMIANMERGKDQGYLNHYFNDVEALTRRDLNDAIAEYFDPARAVTVIAGSVRRRGTLVS